MRTKPLSVLSTLDPVLRDTAIFGLVVDRPGTVVLRHDIVDGGIRRVVVDAGGVIEDLLVPLAHACLSCSVREDAVPTLARLAADPRWDAVLMALPVSAESLPVVRALSWESGPSGALGSLTLARVVTVVDGTGVEADLLGDDLLVERDIALTEDDGRAVGEAAAAQLGHADVVVVEGPADAVDSDLVDHLRAADSIRIAGLSALSADAVFTGRHDVTAGERRLDPAHAAPRADAPTGHGVWTLDLRSDRPLHPERLVREVERLGNGPFRSRGHFWVPSRPDSVCVWDGAGFQLSIGAMGHWDGREPGTRLVFTGVGPGRDELVAAFEEVLLTAEEYADGMHAWLGRADVLEPWLGERSGV